MAQIIQLKNSDGTKLYPVTSEKIYKNLYIGELQQGTCPTNGSAVSSSTTAVCMKDVAAVPYLGVKLNIKLPTGIQLYIKYNDSGTNNNGAFTSWSTRNSSAALTGTTTFTFSDEGSDSTYAAAFYRLEFQNTNGSALTVSTINNYINNGDISITYLDYNNSIVSRNMDVEPIVRSLGAVFTDSMDGKLRRNNHYAVFVHGSDFHNDILRYQNMLDYADYIKATGVFATGDFVSDQAYSGMNYVATEALKHNTPVYVCTGNHDAWGQSSSAINSLLYSKLATPYGYTINSGATYYYKDLSNYKLRIIALDEYITTNGSWVSNVNFTTTQKSWFISTLLSTPANYGVIILMHAHHQNESAGTGTQATFWEDKARTTNGDDNKSGATALYSIIDGFINKTAVSGTWSDQGGSYNYSADFTKLNSGVEFICFCTGHYHRDLTGYISSAAGNKILNLNIGCDNTLMQAYGVRYGRDGQGKSQDLINVYGIDRDNKCIRVARVGCNMTIDMNEVKYMKIPYSSAAS